jgi:hypothetical protein
MKSPITSEKAAGQRNAAIFWLICLVVCYQAGYQVYVSFAFLSNDPTALDPWCNGNDGSAQQCVEAQLFRGWESDNSSNLLESHETLEKLLEVHHNAEPASTTHKVLMPHAKHKGTHANPSAPQQKAAATSAPAAVATPAAATSVPASSPGPKGLISLQKNLTEHMKEKDAERAVKHSDMAHSAIAEWHNMTSLRRDLQALHARFDGRLAETMHTDEGKEEFTHLTNWARDVQALQKHFESEYPETLHGQKAHADVSKSAMPPDGMNAWSQDLIALQHRMETRMEAHNKAHHAIEEMDSKIHYMPHAKHKEAVAKEPTLLEQIAAMGKQMCSDNVHREDPKCAQFLSTTLAPSLAAKFFLASTTTAPTAKSGSMVRAEPKTLGEAEAQLKSELQQLAEKQKAWEKSFVARVGDTMREFCSDAAHKTQSSCEQFRHDDGSDKSGLQQLNYDIFSADDAATKRQAWHYKFASKIANVGHDLCSNPMRRDYAICKKILGDSVALRTSNAAQDSNTASASVKDNHTEHTMRNLSSARIDLHWNAVAEWKEFVLHGADTHPTENMTIAQTDVHYLRTSAHWSGRVPTVACITLVPAGSIAKVWMEYFIDNFRLQNYEGGHQLVLVYHHSDQQAAELVHKYADGSYIKAAVARGDDYPSAAAYRFGAWLARSADVVARWDFGAWHHPHRLSMQVRALAFSERPACVLDRWTLLDADGSNSTKRDGEQWDASIVGDSAWMRSNWYPYMKEERAAFEKQTHEAHVVRVDSPDLLVFDESCRH